MKKLSLLLTFVLVCSMVLGTNTQKASSDTDCDWPMFGRTPEGNRVVPDGCGPASDKLELKWKWEPYLPEISTNIVVNGGRIYYGTEKGMVVCVNESDLVKVWAYETNKPIKNLQIYNNSLVANTANKIFCLTKDGLMQWKTNDLDYIASPITISKDKICFAFHNQYSQIDSEADSFNCINIHNGSTVWSYKINDIYHSNQTVIVNENVYFGDFSGYVYCYNIVTGKRVWLLKASAWAINIGYIKDKLYFETRDEFDYVVDAFKGKVLSKTKSLGGRSRTIVVNNNIFKTNSESTKLYHINPSTGKQTWMFNAPDVNDLSILGGYQEILFVASYEYPYRYLRALNVSNGKTFWAYYTDKASYLSITDPSSTDQKAFLYVMDQNIVKLNVKTGKVAKNIDLFVKDVGNRYPIVESGGVLISSNKRSWTCIDKETRKTLWEKRTNQVQACPLISSGKVLIASNTLDCYDAKTGELVWSNADGDFRNTPILSERYIYISCNAEKKKLFCIDFETGKTIWQVTPEDSGDFFMYISCSNSSVIWLTDTSIYCFNKSNGMQKWKQDINGISAVSISDNKVYFSATSSTKKVCCLDLNNGKKLWEFNASENDALTGDHPIVSNNMVYVDTLVYGTDFVSKILCLDEKTGKTIWEYALNDTPLSSVLSNNRLYISTSGKELYCLDAASGKLINKYQTDSEISTGPIIANGKLYYTIEDTIYCIGDPSDKVLQTMRFQQGSYMMYKNGFANLLAVQPQILSGSLVIPLRAVSQGFGCKVEYDENDKKITLSSSNMTIELWIGNTNALVNGESKTLTVAPTVIKGTTMVPLRFISEAFGAQVNYDAKTKVIDIDWQPQD